LTQNPIEALEGLAKVGSAVLAEEPRASDEPEGGQDQWPPKGRLDTDATLPVDQVCHRGVCVGDGAEDATGEGSVGTTEDVSRGSKFDSKM
jgi:hypothetical protein